MRPRHVSVCPSVRLSARPRASARNDPKCILISVISSSVGRSAAAHVSHFVRTFSLSLDQRFSYIIAITWLCKFVTRACFGLPLTSPVVWRRDDDGQVVLFNACCWRTDVSVFAFTQRSNTVGQPGGQHRKPQCLKTYRSFDNVHFRTSRQIAIQHAHVDRLGPPLTASIDTRNPTDADKYRKLCFNTISAALHTCKCLLAIINYIINYFIDDFTTILQNRPQSTALISDMLSRPSRLTNIIEVIHYMLEFEVSFYHFSSFTHESSLANINELIR